MAYLVLMGLISKEKVEGAVLEHPGLKPVTALIAAGELVPLQIKRHVTSFVMWMVYNSFAWTSGDFTFFRDDDLPPAAIRSGKSSPELIVRGISFIDEASLDTYFEAFSHKRVVASRTPPMRLEQFPDDSLVQSIYVNLGQPLPVEEAISLSAAQGTPLKAKQALYQLIECELVESG